MVGYTPSVSAAVWVGGDGNIPLHDNKNKPIFGSTISGPIWEEFMKNYLDGTPPEKFAKVDPIGKDVNEVTTTQSKPSDTPTPTDTPSSSTSSTPTETETETETSTSRSSRPSRPNPGGSTPPLPGDGLARPPGAGEG
jgi:membrane peptidoglycan carboxypeptidase